MILLDSDHLTVLRYRQSSRAKALAARLVATPADTTVVNVQESMKGWMATLAREKFVTRQVSAYRELAELFTFFAGFRIVLFDDLAAARFDQLRATKVRIGSSDLKIAAIALVNDALLLTANRRDFEKVPGLRFANWLDG